MVKPKQRQNHRAPTKKQQKQLSPNADQPDDRDWMVVKKQRVTIIIPPLPNKKHSTIPSIQEAHLQEKLINTITKSHSPKKVISQLQCPSANSASNLVVHEPEKSRSSPLEVHPSEPHVNSGKPPSLSERTTSANQPFLIRRNERQICPCSISKRGRGMKLFADSTSFLNQRMRASYLEKKLRRAGGLEKWLASLGLTRFIKAFEMRRVGKFQLANLTMQKLKDMGTDAVGPRRKLMHAIDCLCEPHCFQHV